MPKLLSPIFEPLPYYMSAMGMQGARFLEGDPNAGVPDPAPVADPVVDSIVDPAPEVTPPADEGEPTGELGEGGKKALESEREARKTAEKLAKEAADSVLAKDAEVQTLNATVTEKDTAIASQTLEIAKLKALLEFPVKKELQGLIQGTDEASYRASAELLSKHTSGPGVVHKSGTTGDDPNPSGGSIAAGREMFTSKNSKKVGA